MPSRFLTTATGRRLGDHVCWPFHGLDDLVTAARGYVSDGLEHRERVTFCRIGATGMQHAEVAAVAQVGRRGGGDVPVLTDLTDEPGWTPASSALVPFRRMTEAAVADGYTGLRVLTDATDVARDPVTRQLWVRAEHLIDRYALDSPVAVLCGYDVDTLGDEAAAEVACVHARTGRRLSPFLLRALDETGGLAFVGDVEHESASTLYRAVMTLCAGRPGPVVVNLAEQVFVDHTGLDAFHRAAHDLGTRVHLVGASPLTATLVDAFGLTGVTVQEAA